MMPTYTVMINDTKPIWLYCSQEKHCQSGMVAAINAKNSTGKTLAAFKAAAALAPMNISPGGGMASMASSSNSSGSAGSSGGGLSAGSTPAATSGSGSASPTGAPAAAAKASGPATASGDAAGSVFAGSKNVYSAFALLMAASFAMAL